MENSDSEFAKALGKSRLKMPNSNFEDMVMSKIKREAELKSILQNIKYAFLFFSAFFLLGLYITTHIDLQKAFIKEIPHQLVIFQALFVLCFLMQADFFITIIKNRKIKQLSE